MLDMWVIGAGSCGGPSGLTICTDGGTRMAVLDPCLTRCQSPAGQVTVRLGDPLLDAYLEFLEARCRPNSVLAAGFDLQVFFTVVPKPPGQVTTADVLGFITAQRAGTATRPR